MGLWGLLVIVTMLAVLGLALLGGARLYQRLRAEQNNAGTVVTDPARARLRERYAAGVTRPAASRRHQGE